MQYKKNYSTEKNEGKCIMKENWSSKSTLAKKEKQRNFRNTHVIIDNNTLKKSVVKSSIYMLREQHFVWLKGLIGALYFGVSASNSD